MIFLVRDKKDMARDKQIAHHVVDVHMHAFEDTVPIQTDEKGDQLLDPMWLRRYIAFARSRYVGEYVCHTWLLKNIQPPGVLPAFLQKEQSYCRTTTYLSDPLSASKMAAQFPSLYVS